MNIIKKVRETLEKIRERMLDRIKEMKIRYGLHKDRKFWDDDGHDFITHSIYSAVLDTIDYSGRVLEKTNRARVDTNRIKKLYSESIKRYNRLRKNYNTYSSNDDIEEVADVLIQISSELVAINNTIATFVSPHLGAILILIAGYLIMCSLHPIMFEKVNNVAYYVNWVLTRQSSSFDKIVNHTQDYKKAFDVAVKLAALYMSTQVDDRLIDPFLSSLISNN